jgi:glycopeptide antibiotics resistance protein
VRSLSKALFAIYLLILLWLVLFKLSFHLSWVVESQPRTLNLIPFADVSRDHLREMIYNFVVFVPFGLLLSVNLKRANFWRRLALVFIFSLALEIIQFVFAIGVTDVTDVIMNTFGGFLGLILYDLSRKYVDDERLDRFLVVASTISLLLFVLLLGLFFSRHIRFQSPPGDCSGRVRDECALPSNVRSQGAETVGASMTQRTSFETASTSDRCKDADPVLPARTAPVEEAAMGSCGLVCTSCYADPTPTSFLCSPRHLDGSDRPGRSAAVAHRAPRIWPAAHDILILGMRDIARVSGVGAPKKGCLS